MVKQNDDKYARKFYQGISLDDMYTYHQADTNAVFKKRKRFRCSIFGIQKNYMSVLL